MLGEHGTEQFMVETRQDGKLIKAQAIHDPFLTNVTVIALSRWDLFKAMFRKQFITKISVHVSGTESVQRAIMMLDAKQLEAESQAILESRLLSREGHSTEGDTANIKAEAHDGK